MQSHYVEAELKMTDPLVFVWIARFGFFILVIICFIFFSISFTLLTRAVQS